ncbi:MAG TPA: hypothetical protein DCQ06_06300 [Myxococcales bacterium]|nr:hypothetical protein [Myxococcales bacterium]HAN31193.1 hypothetical protein [Myxococcales bacterium]|tara:strand:+ start:101 stop:364 length:264 start_codon:yes stop_codon:yes gene_type:complete
MTSTLTRIVSTLVVALFPLGEALASGAADLSKYKEESVSGGSLLVAAYLVMWALVSVFVVRVVLGQAKTEARLTELSEQIDATGDGG